MAADSRNMDKFPKDYAPTEKELRDWAMELIREQSTMTIATAKESTPWAAPVYFVNLEFVFYFFSDPASRHIQESAESNQASATIFFSRATTWKEIRGVQMSGRIDQLKPGMEALKAVRQYMKKFPFVEEFFQPGQGLDLDAFSKRFRVRFYRFRPDLLYYMDNRIRFSFREKVPL